MAATGEEWKDLFEWLMDDLKGRWRDDPVAAGWIVLGVKVLRTAVRMGKEGEEIDGERKAQVKVG